MIEPGYYYNLNGEKLKSIALKPVSTGLLHKTRLELNETVVYEHVFGTFICPPGYYDGYSVPKVMTLLTIGMFQPFMPVVECTLPHDVACREQYLTREKRTELFKDAYDDAVRQFYDGEQPDRRRDQLIAGVFVGSKIFGRC